MNEEQKLWNLLKVYPRLTFWLCSLIILLFVILAFVLVIVGATAFQTREAVEAFLVQGSVVGFSILGMVYIMNWFICYRFLKKARQIEREQITDPVLERLLKLYTDSCILYMIPITFLKSLRGFGFTNRFAHNKLKKRRNQDATDQRLYKYVMYNESKRGLGNFFQVTKTK